VLQQQCSLCVRIEPIRLSAMLPPPIIAAMQTLGLPAEEPLSVEADFFAAGGTSLQVGAVGLLPAVFSLGSPHTQTNPLQ
jgi:hypothetical protein